MGLAPTAALATLFAVVAVAVVVGIANAAFRCTEEHRARCSRSRPDSRERRRTVSSATCHPFQSRRRQVGAGWIVRLPWVVVSLVGVVDSLIRPVGQLTFGERCERYSPAARSRWKRTSALIPCAARVIAIETLNLLGVRVGSAS